MREAIVLTGGFGTRLKSEINDLPKCLTPIKGMWMLFYLSNFLKTSGSKKFIFSLGYQNKALVDSSFAIELEYLFKGDGSFKFPYKNFNDDNI